MKRFFESGGVLDEREMQEVLGIEHRALSLLLVILVSSMVIQVLAGLGPAYLAGEAAGIVISCVYMVISYTRRGIWDTESRPSTRSNLTFSVILAAAAALVAMAAGKKLLLCGLILGGTFVVTFFLLSMLLRVVRQRKETMEREYDEE